MSPKGKAQGSLEGSAGKGRPESSLTVEEHTWSRGGWGEATCKGPVTSRRERLFRGLVPDQRGTVPRVSRWAPAVGVFRGTPPVGLSGAVIPASGPRGQPCQPGACGGCLGLGGHCQASSALPSFRLRSHPTPSLRESPRRGAAHPSPGKRGVGVPAWALRQRGLPWVWPG